MQNSIALRGLEVFAYHGVLDHEKAYGQEFLIDCELEVLTGENDKLEEAVSYAEIADLLVFETKNTRFDLIETLAAHLAQKALASNSRIESVKLTVHKPAAPIAHKFSDVSVTVTKKRN